MRPGAWKAKDGPAELTVCRENTGEIQVYSRKPVTCVYVPRRASQPCEMQDCDGVRSRASSRTSVVLGREQVAHREAPVRSPAIGDLRQLVLRRDVVERVGSLDRAP